MAKLILTSEVSGLGEAGDIVEVKDGYARNYLVPRKLATAWTKGGQSQVDALRKARKSREIDNREDAKALRDALQSKPAVVSASAGKGGRLFGSVTTAAIADAVAANGQKIDKRKIEVLEPMKSVGSYTVSVRLHPEVLAKVVVKVVAL